MSDRVSVLPEELLKLIRHGESFQIEYKEAKTELPKNLFDSVCSFSNREGGDIFLGVHDTGVILGVDPSSVAKIITNFVTLSNNKDKIFPPLYLTAREYVYFSDGSFSAVDKKGKLVQEQPGEYHVIHIHIPVSPSVVRHKGRIFDRNDDGDMDITDMSERVYQCYARKQSTYYVNKVYPHWKVSDLREDLIEKVRKMAISRKQFYDKARHPWANMNNEELLRTSGLILTDEEGRTGITLAAVLLFGTDSMIASACAHHKTDCIYRVYNLDRYDDREVILTNLIESYEKMFAFGQKHLNDLFVLDGVQSVSARDIILREIISNSLAHRDYSNGYVAKLLIEKNRIIVENGNRAHGIGALDIKCFEPFAKNPAISKVFREIGYADELGSGMRNSYKYTLMYSGAEPEFIEGDVFKIIIPLSVGSLTKVGPGNSPEPSGQVKWSSGQVVKSSGQVEREVIAVKLDIAKINELLNYCTEARTREELQKFCEINSRDYFRKNILIPLLNSGRLKYTIPDRINSSKQKYIKA
ncbi:MAG: putative DNA binding domain-containing protein [Lachnospiraceae bacterium]|nr:putative DNA binding domain-containing protein [Lachnospiraceae bacterium]